VTQSATTEPIVTDPLDWRTLPGVARVYVTAVITVGAIVTAIALSVAHPRPVLFGILLACSCLTSAWKVELRLPANSSCTLSVSYAADLMALILLGPAPATIVAVAGAWTQCTFNVREPYPWYRTAFSMSAEAVTMCATGAAYVWLGGAAETLSFATLPRAVVIAIVVYFVVNSGLVAVAIGLSTRASPWRIWHDDFLWSGPSFIVAGTAGAIGAVVIQQQRQWLAILAIAPLYLTYRTYHVFLRRIEDEKRHASETGRLHAEAVEALAQAKQAEQALAREKERLAVMLRSVGDGVIATDLDGRVLLINQVAEALTGWSQADALGRMLSSVFQTFEPDTRAPCDNSIEALTSDWGQPGACRSTILVARDLTEHPIEEIAAPLRDGAGLTCGIVVAFRDITAALQMREERTKANRVASLGLLAGGIAHDFNNILMAVTGNVSLARASLATNSAAALSLADAEQACLRARQLTWQLLTFSKGGVPVKKIVSPAAAIQEAVMLATRGTNVSCRLTIPPDLWPVSADESQLVQVFSNVIINAQQSMPRGGTIEVSAENVVEKTEHWEYALRAARGPYVRISVIDRGIGIPEENIGRIFDPYFTTKQVGSGLGLATSYTIVKHHGGHVAVQSQLGRGTTVQISLPASVGPAAASGRDAASTPVSRTLAATRPSGARILVMDDEQSIRTLAVNMLTYLGHEAEAASDGTAAVEQYRRALGSGRGFDAVILDLIVPGGMGGRETMERLAEIDPAVTGIIVSGYAQDPVVTRYREHGFKGVIGKPFTLQELRSTLDEIMLPPGSWTVH
jgi:PAS domain S-box-containing protein